MKIKQYAIQKQTTMVGRQLKKNFGDISARVLIVDLLISKILKGYGGDTVLFV
jgi:hypothetical protein